MLKQLFLVSILCTAPTMHASQEEQDAYQHAQLCLAAAVATFSLVYVLGKKCFDKKTPQETILQAATPDTRIPTKPIIIIISDAPLDDQNRPASPIKRKQKKNPSKKTQTTDKDFRITAWQETHAVVPKDFVRDNTLNQGRKVTFTDQHNRPLESVRTISPTKDPEQEHVRTRAQKMKDDSRMLQGLLIRQTKPT